MTAQIPDTFIYEKQEYELVGLSGEGLPTAEFFGMKPKTLHTACWRGYYMTFEIKDNKLFLKDLFLRTRNGKYKSVNGIKPKKHDEFGMTIRKYENIDYQVPFTGKIRLAKDFIDELYIHMGFQKPSAFKTVIDFTLKNGQIIKIEDISKVFEKKRGAFKKHFEEGGAYPLKLLQLIDESFSLDMDIDE